MRLAAWANTDITPDADFYLDATAPWPVEAGTVTHVYGDNVVEHLTLDHVRVFLAHARRAMAPGGRLRLATPDAGMTARLYVDGGPDAEALLDRHRRHGYQVAHQVDLLRILFATSEHWRGYCFDETSLRDELDAAGFVDVRRWRTGESDDPVMRGLEQRTERTEDLAQLVLEARVPEP